MERLDHVEIGKIREKVVIGSGYKLGISLGDVFSHYEQATIIQEVHHGEYTTSYKCLYPNGAIGYRWDESGSSGDFKICSMDLI